MAHGRLTHELVESVPPRGNSGPDPKLWRVAPRSSLPRLFFGIPFLLFFVGLLSWILPAWPSSPTAGTLAIVAGHLRNGHLRRNHVLDRQPGDSASMAPPVPFDHPALATT